MTSILLKTLCAACVAAVATAGCYRDRTDVTPSGQTNMQPPSGGQRLYVMPPGGTTEGKPPSDANKNGEPRFHSATDGAAPQNGSSGAGEDDRRRGQGGDKSLDKKDLDKAPK